MIDSSWQKNYPPLEKMTENLDDNSSLAKLLGLISENTRVIDFGCATGYLAYLLKRKGCVVTGVEINEQAASIAEEYCERVIVCDLDITRLLDILPKQTFDVAVFGDVLEHLRDPWRILQETKELLLPQGYVVASIPNIAHGAIRLSLLQGKFDYQELGILDNTHLRFFTRKTVEELFEKSGYLSEIVDRTHLPILENSPLIPSLELNHLDNKLVEDIQNARETDTLQFIVRAFPASVENQYDFLKTKFLENSNLLESSQTELQQTKGLLESSQTELQQTKGLLESSQTELQQTKGLLESSQSELQQTKGLLESSQSELQQTKGLLESSQTELQRTRDMLKYSKVELQRTRNLLGTYQSEVQQTKSLLENSQTTLQNTRERCNDLEIRINQSQSQLEVYRSWIEGMESSKFWKLREKWFGIKYALKLDDPEKHRKPASSKSIDIPIQAPTGLHSQAFQFYVDQAILVPELGIYIEGWLFDPKNEIQKIMLVTENENLDILPILVKKTRMDLVTYLQNLGISEPPENLGFLALCPLKNTSNIDELYFQIQKGEASIIDYKTGLVKSPSNPLPIIQNILANNPLPNYQMRPVLNSHIGPTVWKLWQNRERIEKSEKVIREYGVQVKNPAVSIIVPLYGRIDFIKYQLALFADDPDLKQNELIYVLDDPRLYEDFLYLCDSQSSIFEIPFKTVYTGINQGYAGANNSGVSVAKGRLLLLLNSDVMPVRSRWLSSLIKSYNDIADVGVIAPKLLYGDGSIQHAGMKFLRYGPWENLFINDHPKKGLPNFVERNSCPQELAAVTGACIMVSRELYDDVGGIDEEYIIGDFEDSDLCLKLHAKGFKNYYIPGVELFHLERQSLSLNHNHGEQGKRNQTLYNCWLFNQKWEQYILENIL
ncbi:methyltransferase domain-containing protein [Microcystis aeruginosa]|uniref:methyltransferase domain-containing protein n=1 Tax=Microcystis aeruginosa TaxID=1126 RepID=UPI00232B6042|nr:methyltransferase domain-containing protein [Microcystis aeruginosa]MDB9411859.1 methyltransferase domain-containing protein [Microcystis aeruginosa CS-567/02]